jgi:dihydrofolate reductase
LKKIIIAAVAKNNVIGKNGKIPWKIPTEQQFFREKTIYNPILMGRKTFESLKHPLEKRLNLVLSRKKVGDFGIVKYFKNNKSVEIFCSSEKIKTLFIIGGEEIFNYYIDLADEIIISEINLTPKGDTYFPVIKSDLWKISKREDHDHFNVTYFKKHL